MEGRLKRLFASEELRPGASIRFPLEPPRRYGEEGFAHRAPDGSLRAWVNVCPHRAQPIDLGDGRLFNALGQIECQAHGARFDPEVGIEGSVMIPLSADCIAGTNCAGDPLMDAVLLVLSLSA